MNPIADRARANGRRVNLHPAEVEQSARRSVKWSWLSCKEDRARSALTRALDGDDGESLAEWKRTARRYARDLIPVI
jgi:hypothetical protein